MNNVTFYLAALWLVMLGHSPTNAQPTRDEGDFYGTEPLFHQWNPTDHTRDGYDWSVPDWVAPSANSGIVHSRKIDGKPADEILLDAGYRGRFKRRLSWNWRKLEPEEGFYDLAKLRSAIDSASDKGKFPIELKVYAAVAKYEGFNSDGTPMTDEKLASIRDKEESAPKWLDRYNIPKITFDKKPSNPFRLTIYDEYHPDYHSRYLEMVKVLDNSGILQDDRIAHAYIHLGSSSRGEEGIGPSLDSPNRAKYEARLEAWADAFGEQRHRLMLPSSKEQDLKIAYQLGVGQRNGFVENFLQHVANPALGTYVTPEGYLEVDEDHPLIKGGLASGDENEEYYLTAQMEARFGDFDTFKHRYREATLRALQMRRTTLWDAGPQGFVGTPLSQFAALSLGKDINTTADAWCYLRQNNLKRNLPGNKYVVDAIPEANRNADGSLPAKNFERWLYQRDGDDIKTIATRPRGQGGRQLLRDSPEDGVEYTARRTDVAAGYNKIGLALDDRFAAGGGTPVAIKVTYEDNSTHQWYLQYTTEDGRSQRKEVTNSNSGELRTVTWILDDIAFEATGKQNDFFLVAQQGDLTASFVRVVKLSPPGTRPDSGEDRSSPYFYLENKATGQWILPQGCSDHDNGTLRLVTTPPAEAGQCAQFEFVSTERGYAFLQNHSSGLRYRPEACDRGKTGGEGSEIVQIPGRNQGWCAQWRTVDAGGGYVYLENRQTGIRLAALAGDTSDTPGAVVTTSQNSNDAYAQWRMVSSESTASRSGFSRSANAELYPNPANDKITLKVLGSGPHSVVIYGADGAIRKQIPLPQNRTISVADLARGVYVVKVVSPDTPTTMSHKLIIER